jgi:hypothetical protein
VVMALMPEGNAAACVALVSSATILSSKISCVGVVQPRVHQPGLLTVIAREVVRALEELRAFGCTAEFEGRGAEYRGLHAILGQPRAVPRMDDRRGWMKVAEGILVIGVLVVLVVGHRVSLMCSPRGMGSGMAGGVGLGTPPTHACASHDWCPWDAISAGHEPFPGGPRRRAYRPGLQVVLSL